MPRVRARQSSTASRQHRERAEHAVESRRRESSNCPVRANGSHEWWEDHEELRVDPNDGSAYTMEQFQDWYGDLSTWNLARPYARRPGYEFRLHLDDEQELREEIAAIEAACGGQGRCQGPDARVPEMGSGGGLSDCTGMTEALQKQASVLEGDWEVVENVGSSDDAEWEMLDEDDAL
eukprot:TRINITY_DN52446_c0_g1_i2.p2 TRINITY_DN52446_c0_g1~~TRINITY_DN52446_c0_g1_i2.p2  ORF type:complete len:178 (+),score=37.27 TRINITY_DN52446_c0_g1_i2:228-761(+)